MVKNKMLRRKILFTLSFYVSLPNLEIKDTLTLLDKAINNKETRTISRITKNVKKYRNIIKGHHLNALYECLGWEVPQSIKNSSGYNS